MRDTILPNLAVINPLVADIVLQMNAEPMSPRAAETIIYNKLASWKTILVVIRNNIINAFG